MSAECEYRHTNVSFLLGLLLDYYLDCKMHPDLIIKDFPVNILLHKFKTQIHKNIIVYSKEQHTHERIHSSVYSIASSICKMLYWLWQNYSIIHLLCSMLLAMIHYISFQTYCIQEFFWFLPVA